MSDKKRYDSTRDAWESIWDSASVAVELETIQYPRAKRQIQQYLPYLPQDDIILEAGSGLSAAVITLRDMGYHVIGLDYAENALHTSRQHTPNLPLLAGDVHALPHPDNSIGAYLSFGVLEHFEQGMGAALQEAYRVLKPNGVAVITIPYPNIIWKLAQWRREQQGRSLIDEDFYESTYTREQLIQEMSQVGFSVLEAVPSGHSYTFWGVSSIFQGKGYYQTNRLAETLGAVTRTVAPWLFNFMTMIIARK
ncbi:MAG: class I SAM-dependent methyltransferase [Anaerolineae bacterium]|nr:class I SAM-dependent methyltransferase [Anaerolineae bacterium]